MAVTPIPDAPVVPQYPALGSPTFNQEAYTYGTSMPGVTQRIHEIALSSKANAEEAGTQAQIATTQAQLATTQVEIATTQANAASAAANRAESARDRAVQAEEAVEQALIDGPVLQVNGQSGLVVLDAADVGAEPAMTPATQVEMEAGTESALRSMSPASVKAAIDAGAPVGTIYTGLEKPVGDWVETGKVYLQSSYPELFLKLGFEPTPKPKFLREVTLPSTSIWKACWLDDDTILAVGYNASSISYDKGVTWTHRSVGYGGNPSAICCDRRTRRVMVAHGSALRTSIDDGETWTTLSGVVYSGNTTSIAVDDQGRWLFAPDTQAAYSYPVVSLDGVTTSRATTEALTVYALATSNGRIFSTSSVGLREYDFVSSAFLPAVTRDSAPQLVPLSGGGFALRYANSSTLNWLLKFSDGVLTRHLASFDVTNGFTFVSWKNYAIVVYSFTTLFNAETGAISSAKVDSSGTINTARSADVSDGGLVVTSHGYSADGYNYYRDKLLVIDLCNYDRATQFYVPNGAGAAGKEWIKA